MKTAAIQITYNNLPVRLEGNIIKLMMQFLTISDISDEILYNEKEKTKNRPLHEDKVWSASGLS